MIDHIGLVVRDYPHSRNFYRRALEPLGYLLVEDQETVGAFGPPGMPLFWLYQGESAHTAVHVALSAADRGAVDAFHAAALAAGGDDNGAPGPRPEYHAHYYAAFVLDPDGNNLEAVCHRPPD